MSLANQFFSFEQAITDPRLFKKWYDGMSVVQQTVVRAYYGLSLPTQAHRDAWAILNDAYDQDELGYPTAIREFPYEPKEYEQLWAIIGRRGGKTTLIGALIFAYECCFGGHMQHVLEGQEAVAVLISQVKEVALKNLKSIELCLKSSPLASKMIVDVLADSIPLRNGITIVASAPNIKNQRGLAIPVVGMDEVGFWYKDADSANPDIEVERAVAAAQQQFPRRKRFGISTPWSKEGLLYEYHVAGTEGRKLRADSPDRDKYTDILVVEATTAAMTLGMPEGKQPHITRAGLKKERARDPLGFIREYLKQFVDAISAFLTRAAVERALKYHRDEKTGAERAPRPRPGHPEDVGQERPYYVAAIDPAFRSDSFAFVILHNEPGKGIVVDKVRRWTPQFGIKLNPEHVIKDMLPDLHAFGITHLYTDQYQLEALTILYQQVGIVLEGVDFTSRSKGQILGNLAQLFNQGRIHLLDPELGLDQKEMFDELLVLEKILRPNGTVSIAAPVGKQDDMAMVLALAAFKAMWMLPSGKVEEELPEEHRPKTLFQRAMEMLKQRFPGRFYDRGDDPDDYGDDDWD